MRPIEFRNPFALKRHAAQHSLQLEAHMKQPPFKLVALRRGKVVAEAWIPFNIEKQFENYVRQTTP